MGENEDPDEESFSQIYHSFQYVQRDVRPIGVDFFVSPVEHVQYFQWFELFLHSNIHFHYRFKVCLKN